MRHFVFDAYGTLFDVHSAASHYQGAIGPAWERLSQTWRAKHLEYTWIHAQTGHHISFWTLAQRSLDYAIALVGGVPEGTREKLLSAYRTLLAYPEVPDVLKDLKRQGAKLAILTNGDRDMIDDAVASAGLGDLLDQIITVHEAGIYKPSGRVYQLACDRLRVGREMISFQSSNRWDIAGAKAFGFRCVWINRSGMPDEYPDMPADHVIPDLRPLPAMASKD
jgi:2-haloacid dehalogenase